MKWNIEAVSLVIILLMILPLTLMLGEYIGYAVHSTYEDNMDLSVNDSTVSMWVPSNSIDLYGVAISGSLSGSGRATTYLVYDEDLYHISTVSVNDSIEEFDIDCAETCSLPGFSADKYLLRLVTEGEVIYNVSSIIYSGDSIDENTSLDSNDDNLSSSIQSNSITGYAVSAVSETTKYDLDHEDYLLDIRGENHSDATNFTHLYISDIDPYGDLVGYWNFDRDDNLTAIDFTANDNDGTYVTNAYSISGLYGNSLELDGSSGVLIPSASSLDITGALTISTWIKTSTAQQNKGIINKYKAGTNQRAYGLYTDMDSATRKIYFTYQRSASSYNSADMLTSSRELGNDEWTHVVAVFIPSTSATIYLNGVQDVQDTSDIQASIASSTEGIRFGYSGDAGLVFTGSIDEVMIFNRSLNSTEISAIYNNQSARFKESGTTTYKQETLTTPSNNLNVSFSGIDEPTGTNLQARVGFWNVDNGYNTSMDGLVGYWNADGHANDSSGDDNHGTFYGDANANGVGVWNNSFSFDGTPDRIKVPYSASLYANVNMTVSYWFNSELTNYVGDPYLVSMWDTNSNRVWATHIDSGSDKFGVWTSNDGTSGAGKALEDITSINVETGWHHILYIADNINSDWYFYYDGEYIESLPNLYTYTNQNSFITIGGIDIDGFASVGSIDDVMIFNRSLTESEIKELYNKGRANWQYSDYQNITTEKTNYTFAHSENFTNYLIESKLESDSYNFYTPLVYGSISSTDFYEEVSSGISIEFVEPTPDNDTTINNRTQVINVSIIEGSSPLNSLTYNWNETNTTFYNDSLVMMMNFDNISELGENSTNIVDVSRYGENATNNGATWTSSGKYNGAYSFGSSTSINLETEYLPTGSSSRAISLWIKPTSSNARIPILLGTESSGSAFYPIMINDNICIGQWGGGDSCGSTTLNTNTWYYIVMSYDGSVATLYLDGVSEATKTKTYSTSYGTAYISHPTGDYFKGVVDEVRIWNKSLSLPEIQHFHASNLRKYDTDKWELISNQTGLTTGTYTYQAIATDNDSSSNTEQRTLNVAITDSCTYSSGTHYYQCSDHCNLTENVNHQENHVFINGTGTFRGLQHIINSPLITITNDGACTVYS